MLTVDSATMEAFAAARRADHLAAWQAFLAAEQWAFARARLSPGAIADAVGQAHRLLPADPDHQGALVLALLFHEDFGRSAAEIAADVAARPATAGLLAAHLAPPVLAALGVVLP